MDVFALRDQTIKSYGDYVLSFLTIKDQRIEDLVRRELENGLLWPDPLIQLNPAFKFGSSISELVEEGILHPECKNIFSIKPDHDTNKGPIRLYQHQIEGIKAAKAGDNYVLTTGTGSGKSLAYIVPIVDHVLRNGSGKGIQAVIVYPMNALANSQIGELQKFLRHGYPQGHPPVTFKRYTGQESEEERQEIIEDPPDILLTNYVMLELVLTRPRERNLVRSLNKLRFLVLDELHTYRGRQGADVAILVRRVREASTSKNLIHIGTSATLLSEGAWEKQQKEIAEVATSLFGVPVKPERIIGETLRRVTPSADISDQRFINKLRNCVRTPVSERIYDQESLINDPLSIWIESRLGVRQETESGRLIRSEPLPLTGPNSVSSKLAKSTGVPLAECEKALKETLLAYRLYKDTNGNPLFAFKLHQFVSKGEAVYASLEPENSRHITLQAQKYVPGSDRKKILLPLAFCRECGQEYYVVRKCINSQGYTQYIPRELSDRFDNDDGQPGFLYINTRDPWPSDGEELINKLPDSWIEDFNGVLRIKRNRREQIPRPLFISPEGIEGSGKLKAHYISAPFRFCMNCGVDYGSHQRSDFGKLTTLGSEGRSTATTILSLSIIRGLRKETTLEKKARKLLSFTDNRQDASLQAGHFNDFVEIGLLRSALWRAINNVSSRELRYDDLIFKVFEALDLPLELYAINPNVEYLQLEETQKALRRVIGYYLYRDLRRGWRVTSPNLEQCGLLKIDYISLAEFCNDESKWKQYHPVLANATPEDREKISRVLLDYMRRELAIRVEFLDPLEQEKIQQISSQYLIPPWSIDDKDQMERTRIIFPRSRPKKSVSWHFSFLSPRGGYALFLKRPGTFSFSTSDLKTEDLQAILLDLLNALCIPGLVHRVVEPKTDMEVPGYQLNASGLIWKAGEGTEGFHDPVRTPSAPEQGHRTNPFFIEFYKSNPNDLKNIEAREHTAQVPSEIREERELKFREGSLPILYCSPTMELGVDISQLNVVNLRNVPPTPANYAQRSGRAGRSGQPALVLTYCAAGSPHDQYFFKRPELMVAGSVSAPRVDLANEDLLKAHVHAIWLAETGLDLKSSLTDILNVEGDDPSLELLPHVRSALNDLRARERAKEKALNTLKHAVAQLLGSEELVDEWLDKVINQIPYTFESACNRWRSLYRAALGQAKRQSKIIHDASRSPQDRRLAERLRKEAENQLNLLRESEDHFQSDFYSYRYFASEGFLPGYNFPRLPLSAYLPGTRRKSDSHDFLSRPRFLAISEFGPRAIIYHEGSRFVINKVILPVEGEDTTLTRRASLCNHCGYLHELGDEPPPDLCHNCGRELPIPFENLFRMQNVATRRRDRINSDEEERFRLGYEIKTCMRFAELGSNISCKMAALTDAEGNELVSIRYGHAATLWRINMGWLRRRNKDQRGFVLDMERGYWAKNEVTEEDPDDPTSQLLVRVVPYVEDRKNCILLQPAENFDNETMASLQAALKSAIQVYFQLEDNELAAEPLPDFANRRLLLFYEAAEGGAGVLRRLVEEAHVLPNIARLALEICHFHPDTGTDLKFAKRAKEECDAACYDCLLSYYNQYDHRILDRKLIAPILFKWKNGQVVTSPTSFRREDHLRRLMRLTDSALERKWLDILDKMNLRLPTHAQVTIKDCEVRVDFLYKDYGVAIFVDGPPHDNPAQQKKDIIQQQCLEDLGYHVIRFHHNKDWTEIFKRYPNVFNFSNSTD